MDKIKLEDFLEYSYLSGIKVTEYGTIFIKANIKKDKTGYERNYWIIKDGEKPKQLTFDGNAGFFTVKDNNLYFLAKRSEEEKKDEDSSVIYALPLDGGEAHPETKIDSQITSFDFISDDTLIATKSVDKRTENLSKEERTKKEKELEGYEDIEECGFYLNGEGYTNGRRSRLVYIKNKKCERVFDDDFSLQSFSLSPDKSKILAVGETRKSPKEQFYSEIREVDTSDWSWKTILPLGQLSGYCAFHLGEKIVAIGNTMDKYGLNQNPDFFTVENEKIHLLKKWGEAIGNTVGTDVRFGGGQSVVRDGEQLYFTTTLDYSSYVYRIDNKGNIESVIGDEGSVDSFSVKDGKLMFVGMRGQKPQEIYN